MHGHGWKFIQIVEIVRVGTTTLEVSFANGHVNIYAQDKVSYLCRPPTPITLSDAQIQSKMTKLKSFCLLGRFS